LFDESEEIRRPKEPGQPGNNPGDLSADTGSVPIYIYTKVYIVKKLMSELGHENK
jgi:hypothetical protein